MYSTSWKYSRAPPMDKSWPEKISSPPAPYTGAVQWEGGWQQRPEMRATCENDDGWPTGQQQQACTAVCNVSAQSNTCSLKTQVKATSAIGQTGQLTQRAGDGAVAGGVQHRGQDQASVQRLAGSRAAPQQADKHKCSLQRHGGRWLVKQGGRGGGGKRRRPRCGDRRTPSFAESSTDHCKAAARLSCVRWRPRQNGASAAAVGGAAAQLQRSLTLAPAISSCSLRRCAAFCSTRFLSPPLAILAPDQ